MLKIVENQPSIRGLGDSEEKFGTYPPPTVVTPKAKTQFRSQKRPVAKVLGILPVM